MRMKKLLIALGAVVGVAVLAAAGWTAQTVIRRKKGDRS